MKLLKQNYRQRYVRQSCLNFGDILLKCGKVISSQGYSFNSNKKSWHSIWSTKVHNPGSNQYANIGKQKTPTMHSFLFDRSWLFLHNFNDSAYAVIIICTCLISTLLAILEKIEKKTPDSPNSTGNCENHQILAWSWFSSHIVNH